MTVPLAAVWNFDLEQISRHGVAITIQWIVVGLLGTGLSVATIRLTMTVPLHGCESEAAGIVALALGTTATATPWFVPRMLALVAQWRVVRSIHVLENEGQSSDACGLGVRLKPPLNVLSVVPRRCAQAPRMRAFQ